MPLNCYLDNAVRRGIFVLTYLPSLGRLSEALGFKPACLLFCPVGCGKCITLRSQIPQQNDPQRFDL